MHILRHNGNFQRKWNYYACNWNCNWNGWKTIGCRVHSRSFQRTHFKFEHITVNKGHGHRRFQQTHFKFTQMIVNKGHGQNKRDDIRDAIWASESRWITKIQMALDNTTRIARISQMRRQNLMNIPDNGEGLDNG